jgi:hypothetical protein
MAVSRSSDFIPESTFAKMKGFVVCVIMFGVGIDAGDGGFLR